MAVVLHMTVKLNETFNLHNNTNNHGNVFFHCVLSRRVSHANPFVAGLFSFHHRLLRHDGGFLLHAVLHLVDNHDAFNHHLLEFADPHHHQSIGQKTDNKCANQRAENGSAPACQRCSAEYHGDNRVHLKRRSVCWMAG